MKKLLFLALVLSMVAPVYAMDHSEFIEGPFKDATEVTKTCLECHEDQAMDFMKTPHWTWSRKQVINGKEMEIGKINVMNNHCGASGSNNVHCNECHAGYGMDNKTFDFTDKSHVDCLICHDTTGTYVKDPDNYGWPEKDVKLEEVAKNVGLPVRQNCTSCHALGGGGNNAKHGDLGQVLDYPDRAVDVHMDADGNDFQCQECHKTENHNISGASMQNSPDNHNAIGCEDCHDADPHEQSRLNAHAKRVACQTCHIPIYAKEDPTQMDWDWSTAGHDKAPNPEKIDGKIVRYSKATGTQTWKTDQVPSYAWFNGKTEIILPYAKIDPKVVTKITYPLGDINDSTAKIHPFKIHTGKQIYDVKNKYFITNHIAGEDGFWKTADWQRSAKIGMEYSGLKYSGEYGFAPTVMYWRLDHMVSPKEQALQCLDCHGDNGRMDWKALGYKGDPMDK